MKNYKKYQMLFTISFVYIIVFMFFISYLYNNSYVKYTKINGIYILDDIIEIVVDKKSLLNLEKNKYIYLNSKKKKIKIISIDKNVYKKNNKYYHQILLKIKGITENTKLNISIFNKKEKLLDMLLKCWKEDNEKN